MDEAEKYKQRLEAIAEKRRLQEEQDKARREMEDEKLRLQQLKRKSLRDQWLMEGAPLSPTSLDAQSPRSPLWGSQAQEIEKRIDKLQAESQQLAEEEEKLKEQMEDGQTESVKVAEAGVETTEEEVKTNQTPLLEEAAAVLTNGRGDTEANINHDTAEQITQSATNGPLGESESVISMKLEPVLSQAVSEAELGQVPNFIDIHEEEEGTLVMRAERVIITDEGDDVPEDLTPQEDQQKTMQPEETPLPNAEAATEGGEAVEEVIKTEADPETFTESEKGPSPEAQPTTGDADVENGGGETKAEAEDNQLEVPASVQLQSPANALEGTTVALVPVYSEAQPCILTPEQGAKAEATTTLEGAEAALVQDPVQDPATMPGQFQEVPLADPQEMQRTEPEPGEQEPLLSQAKAPNTQAEPAAASTETHSPTRANQGEENEAPKRKTCQCCSVM
ncbi:paralemmin-3 isoform X2 [Thunnus thynnus]|uniref:paralemmin-3 isoform X2 n=1 Tax=Thunnus thynnus TaxID=8237 RepID=UPI0035288318